MKFTRKLLAIAVLGLAAAQAAEAQLGRTVDAGAGLYVQQLFGSTRIRLPSGESHELALPPEVSVRSLDRVDAGWILAGSIDTPGRTDLFVLDSSGRQLPIPPNLAGDLIRHEPAVLVHGDQLVGLAWVAGASVRKSAVYASVWSGLDWSPAELVSPVGPGTQIALTGEVLADGSWLLVWSAYDGNDDEIVWSRRSGDAWSAPAVVHTPNDLPDVVPDLLASGTGAMVTWASSEGTTYRVRVALFEEDSWRELPFLGPPGSIHPSLTPGKTGPQLLYRTVLPDGWTLQELDARGVPVRSAIVATEAPLRPGLAPSPDAVAGFEWPGDGRAMSVRVEVEWASDR